MVDNSSGFANAYDENLKKQLSVSDEKFRYQRFKQKQEQMKEYQKQQTWKKVKTQMPHAQEYVETPERPKKQKTELVNTSGSIMDRIKNRTQMSGSQKNK